MIDSCFVEKTNEICDLEGFRREEHTFWISSVDIAFYWFFLFSFYILHKNMKERNKKQHSVSFSISLLIGPKSYVISKNNPIKCSPTFSFSFTQDVQLEIVWDWFHFLFSIILLQIVNRYPVSCSIHSQLNLPLSLVKAPPLDLIFQLSPFPPFSEWAQPISCNVLPLHLRTSSRLRNLLYVCNSNLWF